MSRAENDQGAWKLQVRVKIGLCTIYIRILFFFASAFPYLLTLLSRNQQ